MKSSWDRYIEGIHRQIDEDLGRKTLTGFHYFLTGTIIGLIIGVFFH